MKTIVMTANNSTANDGAASQHSIAAMLLATFMGTMLATTVLLHLNYRKLGAPSGSRRVIGAFLVLGLLQVFVAFHIPPDILSHLASHALLALLGTYIFLRALRRREPWVCDVQRHGSLPKWHAALIGLISNLCLTGLQAKMLSIF